MGQNIGLLRKRHMKGRIIDVGSSSLPRVDNTAGVKFFNLYTKCGATSGDSRAMYVRHYISGAGGSGEAGRFFTTLLTAVAGGAHGIHGSLSCGTGGSVTGLGVGGRFTLHVPNGNLAGTTAAVMAELYADGASSANTGVMALIRMVVSGNATGITALTRQANCVAFHFDAGCADTTNGIVDHGRTANTAAGAFKIYIDGIGTQWVTYGTGA